MVLDDNNHNRQRFILLPHDRFISVLAYKTGNPIATLVPSTMMETTTTITDTNKEKDTVIIESICLTRVARQKNSSATTTTTQDVLDQMDIDNYEDVDADSEQHHPIMNQEEEDEIVVLVGCRDGTIREFGLLESLKEMLYGKNNKSESDSVVDCGPYQMPGPFSRPRRVIRVSKKEPIMHLAAPPVSSSSSQYNNNNNKDKDGILVYVVLRTKGLDETTKDNNNNKISSVNVAVLRTLIPHYDGTTTDVSLLEKGSHRKWHLDTIKCRVGKDKKTGRIVNTVPFSFQSVVKPGNNSNNNNNDNHAAIFLVLARSNSLHVYYEQLSSSSSAYSNHPFAPLAFTMSANNPLTSMSISINNTDVTCGHYNGKISVMNNVLAEVEHYHRSASTTKNLGRPNNNNNDGDDKTSNNANAAVVVEKDPRTNIITTKVHWHAHPVTSLTYDSVSSPMDPILYSGGEESVLVTWQVSQGRDRPIDVLPRLALGGIVHVACADRTLGDDSFCNGILVYAEDNSLQLFESHNKGRMWKVQGLAYSLKKETSSFEPNEASIEVDPRGKNTTTTTAAAAPPSLILTGLPGAPGYMHWYDPSRQRLSASLEVAPFNRISRAEHDESPLPEPSITNHVFSGNGNELITLDETPTENYSIGAYEKQGGRGGEEFGIVSTIRFWSWNDASSSTTASKVPYHQVAAMTYPHGPKNRVSGLALSKDGSMACTVSNDEKSFRVWHKVVVNVDNDDDDDEQPEETTGRLPAWTCRYKVTIPAGYSNFSTSRQGVAFSEDGSILAICFGQMVTLWDAEEARFLTSLNQHLEGFQGLIDSIRFVSPGRFQDLLLIQSQAGVSLKSPFGSSSFKGWSWGIPVDSVKGVTVSSVELVENQECIAVTVFNSLTGQSRLILIDAASGTPGVKDDESSEIPKVVTGIEGCITSMCSVGKSGAQSNWGTAATEKKNVPPLNLYSLTRKGELLLFSAGTKDSPLSSRSEWKDVPPSSSMAPTLDIARGDERKRQRRDTDTVTLADTATKKTAVEIFGFAISSADSKAAPPPTADLPALSKNFVRAFVGRSLSRSQG
jgi:NET1-associated nuclear protein 1 (U3 small nucleolar RNA-associated protein 17)